MRVVISELMGFESAMLQPKQYNPNLRPIGQEFGFIVFIEEVED